MKLLNDFIKINPKGERCMNEILNAYRKRRSHYSLTSKKIVSVKKIESIVKSCLKDVPSAYNIQSTKIVLLFDRQHEKIWDIVLSTLKKMVKPESFIRTQQKIENSFKNGYGTILFFDDTNLTQKLQDQYPTYKENFPLWAEHSNAMLQFAIWTALSNEGLGCSLQHYNPIIDDEVKKTWNIPSHYKLIAQMPFGNSIAKPGKKDFDPIESRLDIYK